ncbi:DUF6702 family protein [uncultured Allomuricauda sp.]|uniref:DUF6702 family protein n=1 Tax=Flagellimonas sp. W118 TaxID=3410791 RepID=UPI002624D826|nr:DUF6702 family protein [uncultured Allomuricauda sp.]
MSLKIRKKVAFLFLAILSLSFTTSHKFYVSVTNMVYSEKDSAFQITSRIFIDDLEQVLEERYGIQAKLATDEESKIADEYIKKYFNTKFAITLDNKNVNYSFLGKQYDNDVVICYLELADVDLADVKSITVQNEILTDLFEEQQNIVHVKWKGQKKSFVLIRENNKGMLNL